MANEFRHGTVGAALSQAEWESITGHAFDAQATGDIPYASSATQLSRLGIGTANQLLYISSGLPAWGVPTLIWTAGVAITAGNYQMGRDADATNQLHFNVPTGTSFEWSRNDVSNMVLTGQTLFLGDTSNANMTAGITINQGSNSDQVLALKGSLINHGMTTLPLGQDTEIDDYCTFGKADNTNGGMLIQGLVGTNVAFEMDGYARTDDTGKTVDAGAPHYYRTLRHDGANAFGAFAVNSNLFAIVKRDSASNATRFLFDVEGSAHADVEWITFDQYDDLALARDFQTLMLTQNRFGPNMLYHYDALVEAGIVGEHSLHIEDRRSDGRGIELRGMVNFTRLAMLHHGVLLQLGEHYQSHEQRIVQLEQDNAVLRRQLMGGSNA